MRPHPQLAALIVSLVAGQCFVMSFAPGLRVTPFLSSTSLNSYLDGLSSNSGAPKKDGYFPKWKKDSEQSSSTSPLGDISAPPPAAPAESSFSLPQPQAEPATEEKAQTFPSWTAGDSAPADTSYLGALNGGSSPPFGDAAPEAPVETSAPSTFAVPGMEDVPEETSTENPISSLGSSLSAPPLETEQAPAVPDIATPEAPTLTAGAAVIPDLQDRATAAPGEFSAAVVPDADASPGFSSTPVVGSAAVAAPTKPISPDLEDRATAAPGNFTAPVVPDKEEKLGFSTAKASVPSHVASVGPTKPISPDLQDRATAAPGEFTAAVVPDKEERLGFSSTKAAAGGKVAPGAPTRAIRPDLEDRATAAPGNFTAAVVPDKEEKLGFSSTRATVAGKVATVGPTKPISPDLKDRATASPGNFVAAVVPDRERSAGSSVARAPALRGDVPSTRSMGADLRVGSPRKSAPTSAAAPQPKADPSQVAQMAVQRAIAKEQAKQRAKQEEDAKKASIQAKAMEQAVKRSLDQQQALKRAQEAKEMQQVKSHQLALQRAQQARVQKSNAEFGPDKLL